MPAGPPAALRHMIRDFGTPRYSMRFVRTNRRRDLAKQLCATNATARGVSDA